MVYLDFVHKNNMLSGWIWDVIHRKDLVWSTSPWLGHNEPSGLVLSVSSFQLFSIKNLKLFNVFFSNLYSIWRRIYSIYRLMNSGRCRKIDKNSLSGFLRIYWWNNRHSQAANRIQIPFSVSDLNNFILSHSFDITQCYELENLIR